MCTFDTAPPLLPSSPNNALRHVVDIASPSWPQHICNRVIRHVWSSALHHRRRRTGARSGPSERFLFLPVVFFPARDNTDERVPQHSSTHPRHSLAAGCLHNMDLDQMPLLCALFVRVELRTAGLLLGICQTQLLAFFDFDKTNPHNHCTAHDALLTAPPPPS